MFVCTCTFNKPCLEHTTNYATNQHQLITKQYFHTSQSQGLFSHEYWSCVCGELFLDQLTCLFGRKLFLQVKSYLATTTSSTLRVSSKPGDSPKTKHYKRLHRARESRGYKSRCRAQTDPICFRQPPPDGVYDVTMSKSAS